MKEKLTKDLSDLNVTLNKNLLYPEFSDYVLVIGEKIIGYGWNYKNEKENVGFMGWAAPGPHCIWKVNSLPENLDFEEVIDLFQFAISEDFIWYSLPTNRQMIGTSSIPDTNTKEFIDSLAEFIQSKFEPKIFRDKRKRN